MALRLHLPLLENYIPVCDARIRGYFPYRNVCKSLQIDIGTQVDRPICSHAVLYPYRLGIPTIGPYCAVPRKPIWNASKFIRWKFILCYYTLCANFHIFKECMCVCCVSMCHIKDICLFMRHHHMCARPSLNLKMRQSWIKYSACVCRQRCHRTFCIFTTHIFLTVWEW